MYEWQYKVARALHHQRLHAPAILRTALSLSCEALRVEYGCMVMFDEENALRHTYVVGIELDGEVATSFWHRLIHQGIIGFVQHGQRVINIHNINADPRWPRLPEGAGIPTSGSAVGIPIKVDQRLLGVMLLLSPEVDAFDKAAVRLLEDIADTTAGALSNAAILDAARAKEASYRRIIDKVQAEKAEAARYEQYRRDLAAMTYHDMRNPLQNIQISLSGLERLLHNTNTPLVSEMLRLAQHSSQQITRMVKGLLDIERLEQGRSMLNLKPVKLDQLLREAVELVRPMAEEAGQTVSFAADASLPQLQIDADMIQRTIINLMENAVKHTPNGGSITVSARRAGDTVCISVKDTGPGVPGNLKDEIFDKFFRVKYSNAPEGVGLGLAFCRLAVEAHGGRIWVENEPDQGAVFSFALPVAAPSVQPRTAISAR
jgi:signal transduction histidine kinase